MERIVITGATSMIGVAIINECLKDRMIKKIFAVVRPNSSNINRLPDNKRIAIIECDSCDYMSLSEKICETCDVFYHIAWSDTGVERNSNVLNQAENIINTLKALSVSKLLKCKKFIGAGSQAEYGKLDIDKISPNSPTNPIQPYGIAKYAAGKLASEEAKRIGIDFFWVRIFSIYGLYDKSTTMISMAIERMKNGERVSFTRAEQRWDYLYCEDAARAMYLIGAKSEGNKVYCLGSGQARPLKEYIYIIRDAVEPELEVGIGDIPYSNDTVMNLCADISGLIRDTGWVPTTEFEEGIRILLETEH